jgi:CRP-like cAMP-binding protein
MASSKASTVEALEHVPLLAELTKRDRQRLAQSLVERTFPPSKEVVIEGRGGVGFFIIVEGRAIVSVGERVVRALGPGDYFGEMALIDHSYRSATITAETELRCLLFTAWVFRPFALQHPETAWALLEKMVQRVREAEAR